MVSYTLVYTLVTQLPVFDNLIKMGHESYLPTYLTAKMFYSRDSSRPFRLSIPECVLAGIMMMTLVVIREKKGASGCFNCFHMAVPIRQVQFHSYGTWDMSTAFPKALIAFLFRYLD